MVRRRSSVVWACTLVLLLQTLVAGVVAGRAAAGQIDPFAGIPICGGRTLGDSQEFGPGAPSSDRHGHACIGDCCLAGCFPGPLVAVLPQLQETEVRRLLPRATVVLVTSVILPPEQVFDRFQARAPPLFL